MVVTLDVAPITAQALFGDTVKIVTGVSQQTQVK
jgi:hypothetical protein